MEQLKSNISRPTIAHTGKINGYGHATNSAE